MKQKKVFSSELAYVCGILALALGTALMQKADFGMSVIVTPAYLLHLKISEFLPFYSFGMSEYIFQALLLICLSTAMRSFKKSYLFSFLTAVLYGYTLDLFILLSSGIPCTGFLCKSIFYAVGLVLGSVGVAFMFNTYITPEVYELIVKELPQKYNIEMGKLKTLYDISSCILSIALSFIFFGFGKFEGIKLGTVLCALINGWLIGKINVLLCKNFVFSDSLSLRRYFQI